MAYITRGAKQLTVSDDKNVLKRYLKYGWTQVNGEGKIINHPEISSDVVTLQMRVRELTKENQILKEKLGKCDTKQHNKDIKQQEKDIK